MYEGKSTKLLVSAQDSGYYNIERDTYYVTPEEFVKSLCPEKLEAYFITDNISFDEEVYVAIKKVYPELYKKYRAIFQKVIAP